uniref:Uncharacterized protein n=1 Tax=Steinernema glaseri TaxID=37863 RepID=A0A1I7ZFC3_9BILA
MKFFLRTSQHTLRDYSVPQQRVAFVSQDLRNRILRKNTAVDRERTEEEFVLVFPKDDLPYLKAIALHGLRTYFFDEHLKDKAIESPFGGI